MNLSKNFTLAEMTASATAKRLGIDNTPSKDIIDNLTELVTTVLQPIRDAFKAPIVVSSGYRCTRLNTAINGAKKSDHRFGFAADIHTLSDKPADNKKLFDLIVKLAKEGKIRCRQIIDEYDYNWIHVSCNHMYNPTKNNQILHLK